MSTFPKERIAEVRILEFEVEKSKFELEIVWWTRDKNVEGLKSIQLLNSSDDAYCSILGAAQNVGNGNYLVIFEDVFSAQKIRVFFEKFNVHGPIKVEYPRTVLEQVVLKEVN